MFLAGVGPIRYAQRVQIVEWMVGARGFEPPTAGTPYRCATGLRYAPIYIGEYSIPRFERDEKPNADAQGFSIVSMGLLEGSTT